MIDVKHQFLLRRFVTMENIIKFINDYFNWLFTFLEGFGVEVPQFVKDNFTTTAAPEVEENPEA